MEHYDLEDMFGRRQKPDLKLHLSTESTDDPKCQKLTFYVFTRTCSGTTCWFHHRICITCKYMAEPEGNLVNSSDLNKGRPVISYDNNIGVVHPNGIRIKCGSVKIEHPGSENLTIEFLKLYCDGVSMKEGLAAIEVIAV